jgi:hypothetical protein
MRMTAAAAEQFSISEIDRARAAAFSLGSTYPPLGGQ